MNSLNDLRNATIQEELRRATLRVNRKSGVQTHERFLGGQHTGFIIGL